MKHWLKLKNASLHIDSPGQEKFKVKEDLYLFLFDLSYAQLAIGVGELNKRPGEKFLI